MQRLSLVREVQEQNKGDINLISKKLYTGDGASARFLSDFIIRSSQFARPYVYIFDNTLNPDGTEDVLEDGTTDQANHLYPTNLWKRGTNVANSDDLVFVDKWQVVDNSILFFTPPPMSTSIWLEVATTAEEFGDTLVAPSVKRAEDAAAASLASANDSAASAANSNTSATESATSAAAALVSEGNAATSATNANTSAIQANTSATNASSSEINASTSAAAALVSENNSSTSATNSAASAAAALVSEGNAATSATESATSAAAALVSENNSATSAAEAAQSAIDTIDYGRKNLLINGGFDIWQRGDNFLNVKTTYTSDRWYFNTGTIGDASVTKALSSGLDGYGLSFNKLASTPYCFVTNSIESTPSLKLKTVTVSAEVYATSGGIDKVEFGVIGIDQKDVNPSSVPTFISTETFNLVADTNNILTKTIVLPDYADDNYTFAVKFNTGDSITTQIGTIYIRKVQLEQGSVATPFEIATYSSIYSDCRRFFRQSDVNTRVDEYSYEMRVSPTPPPEGVAPFSYDSEIY